MCREPNEYRYFHNGLLVNGVVAYDDVYRVDTYVVLLMHQVNISVKFSALLLNGVESSRGRTEYKMLTGNIIVPEFVG